MKRLVYKIECVIVVFSLALALVAIVTHPGICAAISGVVYLVEKIALPGR